MEIKLSSYVELTEKQRNVLDRLLDHKSSKQIARELSISPHTVEQRLKTARRKFGAQTRAELAVMYRCQKETYEESIHQFSDVAGQELTAPIHATNDTPFEGDTTARDRMRYPSEESGILDRRLVPKAFDGPYGTVVRLSVILAFTILFLTIGLAGLAMFSQLSSFLGP